MEELASIGDKTSTITEQAEQINTETEAAEMVRARD